MDRTNILLVLMLAAFAGLTACGGDGAATGVGGSGSVAGGGGGEAQSQACDPENATAPAPPPEGESRDGLSCAIYLPSPLNPDEQIAFNTQYTTTGSRPTAAYAPLVSVSGEVWLPLRGPQ